MNMITITLIDADPRRGVVQVQTTADKPQLGRLVTPAQSLAMDLLRLAQGRASSVSYGHAVPHLSATVGSDAP